jgi:transcriptional regulator with XRE-family HTH domain
MDHKERARRFKEARNSVKETLRTVSELTNIPKSTIANMENEKSETNIGYIDIVKLANHYHVNIAWLMGQPDSSPSLDKDSQTVTRATGLTTESINVLGSIKDSSLINSLNLLIESEGFLKMISLFDKARIINANSIQTEAQADFIEGLQDFGIDNGMNSQSSRLSDRQLIDMYLWRASEIIGNIFREVLKGDKEDGTR